MKLRELLKKVRLRPLEGEGEKPLDEVDALATAAAAQHAGVTGGVAPGAVAPPNWVPSQQDGRLQH
ncbi:MAG TPA: hypothetical protein VE088_03840 [Gaiellaceae bacterium]|jgi:hypothetical protein|nr:hypothetical protein [Gaiellaceae bacterium]